MTDVLIVGAGPTGLTLAAQLQAFGIRFRLIDRAQERAHESRALAVQARSLEIFQRLGIADTLIARGNTSARLMLHFEGRAAAEVKLEAVAADDTRFPYILFVAQAETEAILGEYLTAQGVRIERDVALTDFHEHAEGVVATLQNGDGREERVECRYIVGCDGAHSTVRKLAGIRFEGEAYLQEFMLADVEATGAPGARLLPDTLHPFIGRNQVAIFFPLGRPATWRVIATTAAGALKRSDRVSENQLAEDELSLPELQAVVDGATDRMVRVHDPAWLTRFRLHHRQATSYREGRVFLAGDAAHIHSPVGGQGMNTGIQDAWNLGWKLALDASAIASPKLLDTYEAERWPVGRTLLRFTDRIFSFFVRSISGNALLVWLRRNVASRVLPYVLRSRKLRSGAFRFISQLGIRYRKSPLSVEGSPLLREGPSAGDRFPDFRVERNGTVTWVHDQIAAPCFHILLCGPPASWKQLQIERIEELFQGYVAIHHLTRQFAPAALVDATGDIFHLLGVKSSAQYLVRPDGHIGFRCAGNDCIALTSYLQAWLRAPRDVSSNVAG